MAQGFKLRIASFLVLGSGLLGPAVGWATITLHSYPSYLRNTSIDPVTKEVTINASRIFQNNSDCTASNPSFSDANAPCDSCAKLAGVSLDSQLACNDQEVYPSLPFTVVISSSDAADYPATCTQPVVYRRAGSTDVFQPAQQTTFSPGVANQHITVSLTWSAICGAAADAAGCDKSFDTKFEFGFDRQCNQSAPTSTGAMIRVRFRYVTSYPQPKMALGNCAAAGPYDGICNYTVSPGDQKVFIKNIDSTGNDFLVPDLASGLTTSTDASQMKYSALRVYYKSVSSGAPSSMSFSDPHQDLTISAGSLLDGRVTGLTNGTDYVFWAAMVDQAGTVTYFAPGASLSTNQIARPEEVFGLLDQKGCFIATAAYGTEQAREIHILRDFRDVYLARTEAGRSFIRFYYRHSPQWAAVIRDSEVLRAVARLALDPLIGMADLSLHYGAWVLYLGILSVFSVFGCGVVVARWRKRGKAS